jgi:hypothetical protein
MYSVEGAVGKILFASAASLVIAGGVVFASEIGNATEIGGLHSLSSYHVQSSARTRSQGVTKNLVWLVGENGPVGVIALVDKGYHRRHAHPACGAADCSQLEASH